VPEYHLLTVFTAEDGSGGNPLGVFLDGAAVPAGDRQAIAAELGYSEIVFVDDAERGEVRIFNPIAEMPLAGHPLVGSAWLIEREHGRCDMLRPPAGEVPTWEEGGLRWIRARAEWAPEMELRQLGSVAEVESMEPVAEGFVDAWAWIDEGAGVLRSRVFAQDAGIPEDEATGAAAIRLGGELGRPIEIRQGKGSLLHARPGPDATVEVGGRVRQLEVKSHG
jgi:predicted PhzF superfamily epimerase YddE/YHI9